MGEAITFEDGAFKVPDQPIIPFIEGDGIGGEIMLVSQRVLDAAVAKAYGGTRKIHWLEVVAGEKAVRLTSTHLPDETLEAFRTYRVGIKGPLGTPVGGGIRSLNVALRRTLDLYVCLRPVRYFRGVGSPLKEPHLVDMTVFRENTEDIYSGIEWMHGTPEARRVRDFLTNEMGVTSIRFPDSSSFGVKPVSVEGSERLVRAALRYAIERHLPSVTLVHKGNIMKFTEGCFKQCGYDLAVREFREAVFTWPEYMEIKAASGAQAAAEALAAAQAAGKVIVKDCICDAFLQNTLLRPSDFSVIATMNLNGDYVSDQLAAMVGGIGIAPGANINYGSGHAVFEATHGTAPDIVGEGRANPSSLLLSGVMLLQHIGWQEAGALVERAMETVFASGRATGDLTAHMDAALSPHTLSTTQFAEELIDIIKGL